LADTLAELYKNQQAYSRSKEIKKPRGILVKVIIILAGLGVLSQVLYYGYFAPRLTITRVTMTGLYGVSEGEILGAAGLYSGIMFHQLSLDQARESILQIPSIKDVVLEPSFPNTLAMNFVMREPLGFSFLDGTMYAVDKDGVLFLPQGLSVVDGPVFTGLLWEPWGQVSRVPYQHRLFLEDLDKIRLIEPGIYRLFSQFDFETTPAGGFLVSLYPTHMHQKVKVGARMSPEQSVMLMRVLDMLQSRPDYQLIEDIDFRTGDVIYTKVGGDS